MQRPSTSQRLGLVISTAALALVLVFGFKDPNQLAASAGTSSRGSGGSQGSTSGSSSSSTGAASNGSSGASSNGGASNGSNGSTSSGSSSNASQTVTGPLESTRFGPVQVQITVSGGALSDVEAVALPSGGRSGAISSYAGPTLRSEALAAKSANIDGVSGATYTSRAYAASLQAALDQAGI